MGAIRDTYFSDYGMSDSDVDAVVNRCRNARGDDLDLILDVVNAVNPGIARFLFANLTVGVGYDTMSKSQYVPMKRSDFQGYRRKAIYCLSQIWVR